MWTSSGPQTGLAWIFRELFGFTKADSKYVNISDGGHFENLGVYELVRRRCRFIIVSDAGADPRCEFEDLAGLIRKCRADFGIDIEIDVSKLRRGDGKASGVHCAVGTIRYDHVEPTAPVGTLIYIKPSLTGDEPADIQNYAGKHPDFPHQATLDQFFNESQFESYRALGYHCVTKVFGPATERPGDRFNRHRRADPAWVDANKDDIAGLVTIVRHFHENETENLFYILRKEWLSAPRQFDTGFLKSVEGYDLLQQDFAADPTLARIDSALYPELQSYLSGLSRQTPPTNAGGAVQATVSKSAEESSRSRNVALDRSVELHTACRMLQIMENTWFGLRMDLNYAHPLKSGWANVFQRWASLPALRCYWPLLRNEFSREFVPSVSTSCH